MELDDVLKHHAKILDELAKETFTKVKQYGTDRYEEESEDVNQWMCFSDVYRKTIRLRQLTEDSVPISGGLDKLRETYLELANYGIMAVQIIDLMKARRKEAF